MITLDDRHCLSCEWTLEGGLEATQRMTISSDRHADDGSDGIGVLCLADTIALGALRAFSALGVRVIGFDGLTFGAYSHPSLSTIEMDVPAMADTVITRLVSTIEAQAAHKPPADPMHADIPFRLIQRESS